MAAAQRNRRLMDGLASLDTEPNLPMIVRHSIVHHRQQFGWDCGISCIMMVLSRQQRQNFLLNFKKICEAEGFGKSTWTIDLCYLLHRFRIRHTYTTVTMGVNPTFRNNDYYGPILWRDHVRVSEKIASASEKGLTVHLKMVDNLNLLRHLANHGPIIVLTNAHLLYCDLCHSKESECIVDFKKFFAMKKKPKFAGHYIVLCGYDNRVRSVFYRNPALDDHLCVMSYKRLSAARSCDGTDDDLIFIFSK